MHLLFLCLVSLWSLAQHTEQPKAESVEDLRNQSIMFSIEDLKKSKLVWLERTPNLEYYLRSKEGDKEEVQKIDGREAKKMEMEFASKFIKCQFELAPSPDQCEVSLKLVLKSERQDICEKEDRKSQVLTPFINQLVKKF
ncbi:MAG: hypothetical protein AB7I27_10655 [Bacteriovoracaceae bacterium]